MITGLAPITHYLTYGGGLPTLIHASELTYHSPEQSQGAALTLDDATRCSKVTATCPTCFPPNVKNHWATVTVTLTDGRQLTAEAEGLWHLEEAISEVMSGAAPYVPIANIVVVTQARRAG